MSGVSVKPTLRITSRFVVRAGLASILLLSACQSTMSVEEAKKVTASFSGSAFVPPPRTINDITAILDQQKRIDPKAAQAARAKADQPPPKTTRATSLADFYLERARAANQIGRAKQEISDYSEAARWAARAGTSISVSIEMDILRELAVAEAISGSISRSIQRLQEALAKVPYNQRGWQIPLSSILSRVAYQYGDLETAERASDTATSVFNQLRGTAHVTAASNVAAAQASVAELKGQLEEAEALWREAIARWPSDRATAGGSELLVERNRVRLVGVLLRQERLLEAENEARATLLSLLGKRGRYSTDTAWAVQNLAAVLSRQGRYADAETLLRATTDIYEKTGSSGDSTLLAVARDELGAALIALGRWRDTLAVYEEIRAGIGGDAATYQRFLGSNVNWALALLHTGEPDRAAEVLQSALERRSRLVGGEHVSVAEIRGLRAMALAAKGERGSALREFAESTRILVARRGDADDDESATRGERDRRLGLILTAYIGLFADMQGTALEREAGVSAAVEAFRLAEVARGRSVQRALDASATRAAAKTPALADLVRREQDAKKQVSALYGMLANALSEPSDQQNARVVEGLRSQIDALGKARAALRAQVEREFPAYAQLINPPPATVDQARAALRPAEALISLYVARDRSFVWAIPPTGPVAFAASPLGEQALDTAVNTLRGALDPSAKTLGDIPEFDLSTAYKLYSLLLEPVRTGWERAENLLVVPHGPLGQLPFALLPTKPATLGSATGALFSNYRAVPWLVRSHAVTLLPSVSSLTTLRALPPGDRARRLFAGFGDPYFSQKQAERAARQSEQSEVAMTTRGVPITLRSSPNTRSADSSQLAMLPRLPDTAEEIRSIALAMNADLTRDVFLGERANEKAVKTADLSGYRVIAFATHGLVPGDLDGLTQPALALSAPEVANVDGDGLLTMEEILSLKLNADWVVLSACNTAAGAGSGSEAISGLGRAFFYAGARALLVSNWPVETSSARELTTDLFRRQQATSGLSRAKALQETMNALIDGPGFIDPKSNQVVFTYAHPIFWAPFTLVGDGGGN